MGRLRELTPRISIYSSIRDVVLEISEGLNHVQRLGEEGPEFKSDPVKFPSDHYRFVDCARVGDYPLLVPLDASHQYYRRSRKVRTDIATTMAGNPPSSHGAVQL